MSDLPYTRCLDCGQDVSPEHPYCACDVEFVGMTVAELQAILAERSTVRST